MRIGSAFLAIMLLLPVAAAGHPIPERSAADQMQQGAAMTIVVDATGGIQASGAGTRRDSTMAVEGTHAYSWTYSWGGTIDLKLGEQSYLLGDANLTGGGLGTWRDRVHTVWSQDGVPYDEDRSQIDCAPRTDMSLRTETMPSARAFIDTEAETILIFVPDISLPADDDAHRCLVTSDDRAPHYAGLTPPPLSPLVGEGIALAAAQPEAVRQALGIYADAQVATSLFFEVPFENGHFTLQGRTTAPVPNTDGTPGDHICPDALNGHIMTGTCTAAGTLQVRLVVDPCPMLRESRAVHAAAVNALKQPAPGSSESQARAFQVDAGQKVRAFISDERAVQLMCGGEGDQAVANAARVAQMIVDAWVDVAKKHGLSDDGKRDLLSAERQSQLLGGSDDSSVTNAFLGEVFSSGNGAISVKVHSPVALHAWDEAGRHVGWNATTNSSDVQIEGANYTGEPGGAQELVLPAGFYKLATVELGPGRYALNSGWNGTAGEGAELLPLTSEAGRTVVMNVLLDHLGYIAGPAQRIATEEGASFAFVEPWRPLMTEPPAGTTSATPSGTSGGATATPSGGAPTSPTGAPGASPTGSIDEDGGDEPAGTPAPSALLVVALLLAIAVARRRGSRGP